MNLTKDRLHRLEEAQRRLDMNNRQLAVELRVSEFWLSKVLNGRKPASEDLMLRLEDLLRRRNIALRTNLKIGGLEEPPGPSYAGNLDRVASRIPQEQRRPADRGQCEAYFASLIERAELSDDPNAWPVILHRLKKQFPLDEWEPHKDTAP